MTVAHKRSSSLGLEHRRIEAQNCTSRLSFQFSAFNWFSRQSLSTLMSWYFCQSPSFVGSPLSDLKDLEGRHFLETLALTEWHIEGPDGASTGLDLPSSTVRSRMK